MKKNTFVFLFLLVHALAIPAHFTAVRGEPSQGNIPLPPAPAGSGTTVTVDFYRREKTTGEKREYIGRAELKDDTLTFTVIDKRLEIMLSGNFYTMTTEKHNGKYLQKQYVLKAGTIEHLRQVIAQCKDIGCTAESSQK
ncbi:MAG: hypothetical protein WC335_04455 [Candidatus Omnitrophota bacterium]|jgi:hypothetical protein